MPHLIAGKTSRGGAPAGTVAATRPLIAGVEAEAADGHEDVAVVHEDGDILSGAAGSVAVKLFRSHRAADQSGFVEHMGNRAGTIVTTIIELFVSTTPFIRLALETIGGIHGLFYGAREARRRTSGTAVIIQMSLREQETLSGHQEHEPGNEGRKTRAGR